MIYDVLHIMSETRGHGISLGLRERGKAAWAAATSHPMVLQIGAIIGKAPDLDATDVLTRFLWQIVRTEIPANIAFLRRLDGPARGNATAAAQMLPITYAYTRHLLYT